MAPGSWQLWNSRNGNEPLIADSLPLQVGANPPLRWERAVVGPTVGAARQSGRAFAARDDNVITMNLPVLSDADGHWRTATDTPQVTGSTTLYRNGVRVGTSPLPAGTFAVPGGCAEYRLAVEAAHAIPDRPQGTKVDVVWTFRSDSTRTPTALPLLGVGMAAPVDLRNSVRVGDATPVLITTHRQNGLVSPRVSKIALAVSYDDGKTWNDKIEVIRQGQGWHAQVPHQRGYVSLRVKATDTDQNSVVQTVLRAYQVK